MGMTKNMKRGFSLTNLRLKSTVPSTEVSMADNGLDSPPYSPTASEMERPSLHPQLSYDLRQACAVLITMTNPPEPDDEPDPREMMQRFEAEKKARYLAQKQHAEAKAMKADVRQIKKAEDRKKIEEPDTAVKKERYSTRRPRQESQDTVAQAAPQHYVPKDPQGRHKPRDSKPKPAETSHTVVPDPVLPPVHAPIVERATHEEQRLARQRQQAEAQALGQIRLSMHIRPKTSAAACIDYDEEPANFSSNSTSRTTSDYILKRGRPTSTGLTSLQAMTPSMIDGRCSRKDRRPSESASASDSMKEIQELARQRADEYTANKERGERGTRPGSRQSKLSRMTSSSDIRTGRPGYSRAGSIASSIASGISNYIRPRDSSTGTDTTGSICSGRTSSLGFSSRSRSSSMSRRSSSSNSGWWRNGGLRRRGSWASFRSGGDRQHKERNKLRKDGGPNLNRPLPALPGLDQYRETKTHIGQLVKNNGKKKVKKSKIGVPQPLLPPDTPYTATLPPNSRSHSNLGHYNTSNPTAASAPLPTSDATGEREFPRYETQPEGPPNTERRSTHPLEAPHPSHHRPSNKLKSHKTQPQPSSSSPFSQATHSHLQKPPTTKPRRASLNPIKPRKRTGSDTSASTNNNNHTTNTTTNLPPPPMIRGPSYKRELEAGVYPRRMDVNDGAGGAGVVYLYEGAGGGDAAAAGKVGECERKGGLKGRVMGKMLGGGGREKMRGRERERGRVVAPV